MNSKTLATLICGAVIGMILMIVNILYNPVGYILWTILIALGIYTIITENRAKKKVNEEEAVK